MVEDQDERFGVLGGHCCSFVRSLKSDRWCGLERVYGAASAARAADRVGGAHPPPRRVAGGGAAGLPRSGSSATTAPSTRSSRCMPIARSTQRATPSSGCCAARDLGPLGGVPFAVKDLEDVAGMPDDLRLAALHRRNVARRRFDQRRPPAPPAPIRSARPTRRSSAPTCRRATACSGRRATRGSSIARRVGRAAARPRRSSAAWCRWSRRPTAAARSAIRRPSPGCVGLKPTFRRVPQRPEPILTFDDTAVCGPADPDRPRRGPPRRRDVPVPARRIPARCRRRRSHAGHRR